MLPIQFVITLFAVFAVYRAYRAFFADILDRRKFLMWSCFWTAVVIVIYLPQTTDFVAKILGVGRGVDVVLYISILVLFYGLFQQSRKVDKLERSLTELVRQLAIKDRQNDK